MGKEKLMERARDELFSHVNRCGVLQAEVDDQETWMQETIDYIGERYPDLSDDDLQELHDVGIRFCKPAIPHGGSDSPEQQEVDAVDSDENVADESVAEESEESVNAA